MIAREGRSHGILVSSIHPGGVDTPLQERAGASPEMRASFLAPEDVANVVEFIADAPANVCLKRMEFFSQRHWH